MLAVLLSGCGSTPPATRALPSADVPRGAQEAVAEAVAARYVVDAAASDVRFLVYRAGALARLGHNHVVRAGPIEGRIEVAQDFQRSRFVLRLPVAGFRVDEAAVRAEEGEDFAAAVTPQAVEGTRGNMLGAAVLDAAAHPFIDIESLALTGPEWAPDVTVLLRMRGVEQRLSVPVAVARDNRRLVATAVFELRQSDFGIAPFSVLGGALQVADTLRVRMRLVAQRADD